MRPKKGRNAMLPKMGKSYCAKTDIFCFVNTEIETCGFESHLKYVLNFRATV